MSNQPFALIDHNIITKILSTKGGQAAFAVLGAMCVSMRFKAKTVTISVGELAKAVRSNAHTVIKAKKVLVDLGIITPIREERGKPCIYVINVHEKPQPKEAMVNEDNQLPGEAIPNCSIEQYSIAHVGNGVGCKAFGTNELHQPKKQNIITPAPLVLEDSLHGGNDILEEEGEEGRFAPSASPSSSGDSLYDNPDRVFTATTYKRRFTDDVITSPEDLKTIWNRVYSDYHDGMSYRMTPGQAKAAEDLIQAHNMRLSGSDWSRVIRDYLALHKSGEDAWISRRPVNLTSLCNCAINIYRKIKQNRLEAARQHNG